MHTITLFGQTEVRTAGRVLRTGDFNGIKPRQVLELLALAQGSVVAKPVLADKLWAGRPPGRWQATLETYVAVLRRALQPGEPGRKTIVATAPGGYRLDIERALVDIDTFDRLLADAATLPPAAALARYEHAVHLAARELLEHEPYADWAVRARRRQSQRVLDAAVRGGRIALGLGEPDRAAVLGQHATRLDPLAEEGWQVLIEAHHLAGRRADAVRAYHSCRSELADELGLDPGPATQELLRRALAGDPPAAVRGHAVGLAAR